MQRHRFVVNWFQIVFLREDSQGSSNLPITYMSCELISNCIFTWGFTSFQGVMQREAKLWIDFKLYFYVRIHKKDLLHKKLHPVVNWFQIVFLREDSQAVLFFPITRFSCELISNCIFTWGFTSQCQKNRFCFPLWIDFKLYFYVRIHKIITVQNCTH